MWRRSGDEEEGEWVCRGVGRRIGEGGGSVKRRKRACGEREITRELCLCW